LETTQLVLVNQALESEEYQNTPLQCVASPQVFCNEDLKKRTVPHGDVPFAKIFIIIIMKSRKNKSEQFGKRKNSLFQKGYELGKLCDADIVSTHIREFIRDRSRGRGIMSLNNISLR
jgi:hypothetical protein